MPLDFRTVDVKFTEGLDTKTQSKLVVPGKWLQLTNLVMSDDDTPQRRPGNRALVSNQNGNGLALRNDELLVINQHRLNAVTKGDENNNPASYVRDGVVDNWFIDKTEVYRGQGVIDSQDCAYGNGFSCYVWREYAAILGAVSRVAYAVVEESTGVVVSTGALRSATTLICPRVVFVDNAFFMFYLDSATPATYCRVIATSAPSTLGAETIIIPAATVPVAVNFDACANGTTGEAVLASVINSGGLSVLTVFVTRSGTTPSAAASVSTVTAANVAVASIQAITVASFDGTSVGVFLTHTAGGAIASGTVGATVNSTTGVTTAATLLDATTPPVAAPTHIVAAPISGSIDVYTDQISSYNSANFRPIRSMRVSSVQAVSFNVTAWNSSTFRINAAEASGPQGPFICGKPIQVNSAQFLPVCILENYLPTGANSNTANAQCSFFLLNASSNTTTAYPVGAALYGRVGTYNGTPSSLTVCQPCSTPEIDLGTGSSFWRIGMMEFGDLQLRGINNVTPIGLCSLKLAPNTTVNHQSDQLQASTFLAGGAMTSYDGVRVAEHGFHLFPEGISVVVTAAGTGSVTVGTHQMVAVYEWTDNAGQRHQSAPSPAVSFTVVNATDRLDIIVPTLLISNKTNITISLYMTAAGGLQYYRLFPSYTAISNSTAASNVTVNTAGFTCTDAVLTTCELLYTQPNQAGTTLPNTPPGPCSALAVSQNRLWFNKSDQPYEFGYSQEPVSDIGLRFNESLGSSVPSDSGRIQAFAELDEKTIIFCERKPFVVYGSGPTASGSFNNFSRPQEIPSDVGCSDPLSVLSTPLGIVFKSEKGWYLLGRDLLVKYIGEGAASLDSSSVVSAVMIGDRQQCRFGLDIGYTLVWNYGSGQWSVGFISDYLPAAAAWWPALGAYVHVSTSDGLNREDAAIYTDAVNGVTVLPTWTAQTSWLKLSAMNGYQRVRGLYLMATGDLPNTDLSIQVQFDDGSGATGQYTVTPDLSAITSTPSGAFDIRHKLARQKCKSVSFVFADAGSFTERPITGIQSMALEIGVKKGVNRLPSTQTVG